MKGKILLISRGVPPTTTGSAVIVGNLARQFSRAEMVVLGERPADLPPVYWREDWPEIEYLAPWHIDTRRGSRFIRRLELPRMLARTMRLIRRHQCRAVVAVFPKEDHLLLGCLAARVAKIPFFPYLHNTYLEQRSGIARVFAKWFQPLVFRSAAHVLVMSEGMVELYRERYPLLSCSALVHSFNEELPEFSPPPAPGRILKAVFSGSLNESCRDAAVRVCNAVFEAGNTHLTILSGSPRSYFAEYGILREGVHYETVSRDHLLQRLRECDVVLLPHGFDGSASPVEYQTIFPTKTIEYLICGRPILAHTQPDCFLTRFLRRNQCALIVDQRDPVALVRAIETLRSDGELRSRLVRNALKTAEQFQAPRVAAEFRRLVGGDQPSRFRDPVPVVSGADHT